MLESPMRPTLKDVARLAECSPATASQALNDNPRVSEKTKERVRKAAKMLGYRPSLVAKRLLQKRSKIIGVVMPNVVWTAEVGSLDLPFFHGGRIVNGVEMKVSESGYTLLLTITHNDYEREEKAVGILQQEQVDGIVFWPITSSLSEISHVLELQRWGIPFVFVDRYVPGIKADSVVTDNEQGSYEMVKHLFGLGHKRIAILYPEEEASSVEDRVRGYRKAYTERGLPVDETLMKKCPVVFDSGGKALKLSTERILEELFSRRAKPTAIYALNDAMGVITLVVTEEMGLKIPDDIAFACFDEIHCRVGVGLDLTLVVQHSFDLGYKACELLLDRIDGKGPDHPVTFKIEPKLRIGTSCGEGLK